MPFAFKKIELSYRLAHRNFNDFALPPDGRLVSVLLFFFFRTFATLNADRKMKRHYTIPVFVPEMACPYRCTYCNQYNIAGKAVAPPPGEVRNIIDTYLRTFPSDSIRKVGFFGGSFTGISIEKQNQYLSVVQPYIKAGQIHEIQLSTRPDYISPEILENLKKHHVRTIELGAQSLDDEVLRRSNRGHTVEDVQCAADMILQEGFDLGLQMMIGLPGDTFEKSMRTAALFAEMGARYTRIYPTLVIKDTDLEKLYNIGEYTPLSMEEAVRWCKELLKFFEERQITILRTGLHPSEGLLDGSNLVAGPFHVSFKELVMTALWQDILQQALSGQQGESITIRVSPTQLNFAIGHKSANKKMLLSQFEKVFFLGDEKLTGYQTKISCK